TLSKRERLQISRQRDKLEKTLGGIAELTRLPAAIFIVDIHKEHIALMEAKKLNITTFAMVDTNSDPTKVEFPIPSNDDASKSIAVILDKVSNAIMEGMDERKASKDKAAAQEKKEAEKKEADKKAADKKAAEKKIADKKAAEIKLAENKAAESKDAEKESESTEKAS
ncbi:MAG: small subunit ribosomal protein S2, partial [Flammeovirgaceae bacterium]